MSVDTQKNIAEGEYVAPIPEFDVLPECTLEILRQREKFETWIESLGFRQLNGGPKNEYWWRKGDTDYKEEFGWLFGDAPIEHCISTLKGNQGRLKIVSFGGGKLKGILTFKKIIEETTEGMGISPNITIVDYALTKKLALEGIEEANETESLRDGNIRLHEGFLEFQDLRDAEDADIMISSAGPFFHNKKEMAMALIIKIARKLGSGGVAFLEMYETSHLESGNDSDVSRYDEKMLKIMSEELGNGYKIEWITIPRGNAFIQVTKK